MHTLIGDVIDQQAEWAGADLALAQGPTSLSWAELAGRVNRLAAALAAEGLGAGARVAVCSENALDLVVLQYALARVGGILVPVNVRLTAAELAYILADSAPALALYSAGQPVGLQAARDAGVARIECANDSAGAFPAGIWSWVQRRVDAGDAGDFSDGKRAGWADTVAIIYTGGTTGRPKGVEISHRRNILDGLSASLAYGFRRADRFLCYGPLYHTAAWDFIKMTFGVGGSVAIMEAFDPGVALRELQRWSCTVFWTVPLALRRIMTHPAFDDADLSSVRLIAYSAYDPTDVMVAAVDAFQRRGARGVQIAHGYGLTEGGPFVTVLRPEEAMGDAASLGTAVPGVRVALLDEAGRIVPTGAMGEICVRSAAVMTGYWRNEEATRDAFRGGWLHTGDIGVINGKGHLVLVDRIKDVIRTAGENVYAKEVEQALVTHPAVEDCAVIGQPDEDYDERIVAVCVPAAGADVGEDDLRSYLRSRLAHFKVPRVFVFRDAIPKTAAGKTNKPKLREELGSTFAGGRG